MTQAEQHELGWDRLASLATPVPAPRVRLPFQLWRVLPVLLAVAIHVLLLVGAAKIRPNEVGLEDGDANGLSVEVLDSAAFDARFGTEVAAAASPPPAPPPSAAAAAPAPDPAPPDVPPEPTADTPSAAPDATAAFPVADDATLPSLTALQAKPHNPAATAAQPKLDLSIPPSALAAPAKPKPMSAAELVNKQLAGVNPRARAGESDAWARGVHRALDRSKPTWSGSVGQAIAEFTVTPEGQMQDLHLVQSSGKPELDRLIIASLRGLQLQPPPPGTALQDRTFDVTYF